jgi:polyphosphate kinase
MFKRVEVCFPIESKKLATRILHDLNLYLQDNSQVWFLQPDGTYRQHQLHDNETSVQAQALLLNELQA